MQLLSLVNSGRERIADSVNLIIPYTDKRVRFEFAGISYRSAGDITYKYRMIGIDSIWRETKQTFLEYPDLPYGDYTWQLVAINKYGRQSRLLSLPVRVGIQFWKRVWFIAAIWVSSILLFWLLVAVRVKLLRRRQREKEDLMRRMNELENTALKSQMNPHFIFNCLNSIQQFIFSGDTTAANQYIAGLARLIRTTLNNSSKTFIYIEDEVDYLSSYLSLEKLRFKDKIDYTIEIDPAIDQEKVLIAPMLVQPYVENGIQHGLRNKKDSGGQISIKINKDGELLIVVIEDNGIGRQKATSEKGIYANPQEPKGMSLTEDRTGIMNKLYGTSSNLEIMDLLDHDGHPSGTRVVLRFPYHAFG